MRAGEDGFLQEFQIFAKARERNMKNLGKSMTMRIHIAAGFRC